MNRSFLNSFIDTLKNLWFRDPKEDITYINDVAVRIRAGILLAIPLYMGLTLYDVAYLPIWEPIVNTARDTYDTDWDGNTIYTVDAIRRTFEYSTQSMLLMYGMFELFASMFVFTARFSPTVLISAALAKRCAPEWKPLVPKRYAWGIGISMMSLCLVFFNPEVLAEWVNRIASKEILPTTENYMPTWIPNTMVWICVAFMWLETVLGYCVGCKVYSLLVKIGVHKEECEACNNIDWAAIAEKRDARQSAEKTEDKYPVYRKDFFK